MLPMSKYQTGTFSLFWAHNFQQIKKLPFAYPNQAEECFKHAWNIKSWMFDATWIGIENVSTSIEIVYFIKDL